MKKLSIKNTGDDRIPHFKENPLYKSDETVCIDSAIWFLDGTINLSHAFISWDTFGNFYYDSVFVTIPKVGGEINYTDLTYAYDELKQKVADVCIAAPGSDKELYIASLTKKEQDDNTVTIKTYATVGSRTNMPDHHPFYEGWMYGDLLGDCSVPPQNPGKDACTELMEKTNYYRDLYINDENMLYVGTPNDVPFTTIYSQNPVFENEDDPNPDDNYYERLLIYQEQVYGYHDCIEEEEMNWYYHKLHYVVYQMVPDNVEEWPDAHNKTFIQIIHDPTNPATGTLGTKDFSYDIIRHQYKIEYRYAIYIGNWSEPESIVGG